jgi:hypothetical protein
MFQSCEPEIVWLDCVELINRSLAYHWLFMQQTRVRAGQDQWPILHVYKRADSSERVNIKRDLKDPTYQNLSNLNRDSLAGSSEPVKYQTWFQKSRLIRSCQISNVISRADLSECNFNHLESLKTICCYIRLVISCWFSKSGPPETLQIWYCRTMKSQLINSNSTLIRI